MTDDRFDELMRDAADTYRRPPEPPLDAMWTAIERDVATKRTELDGADDETAEQHAAPRRRPRILGGSARVPLAIAATLVIGIAIGRASLRVAQPPVSQRVAASAPAADTSLAVLDRPYQVETSAYLGQTAALLIALPSEVKRGYTNEQFVSRAGDLLTTTRLLLDSPAANDPSMRDLLDDLELVLTQVVRLPNNGAHSRTELDLINQALEQRDVIPRLRTAVADISAN